MLKCDFTVWHGCSVVNFMYIFRTPFLKNTTGQLLLSVYHPITAAFKNPPDISTTTKKNFRVFNTNSNSNTNSSMTTGAE